MRGQLGVFCLKLVAIETVYTFCAQDVNKSVSYDTSTIRTK